MSRNKNADYTIFVHEFTDAAGKTRYAVAWFDPETEQYTRPLSRSAYKLTGCHTETCKDVTWFGGYETRAQALRRARYLFGQDWKGEG